MIKNNKTDDIIININQKNDNSLDCSINQRDTINTNLNEDKVLSKIINENSNVMNDENTNKLIVTKD